jgi:hypothetical protein
MTEFKVDIETALREFDRFAETMDLDLDTSEMDADDLAQYSKQKRRLLAAIQKGALVVNEGGEMEYMPQNAKSKREEPLIFHERTGASLLAADGKKKNADGAKTYAVMADLCKVHPNVIAKLAGIDVKVCEAIYTLLMD